MTLGKLSKVRAKCPVCGRLTVVLERVTTRHKWLRYTCYKCNIKFMIENGWKKRLRNTFK